MQSGTMRGKEMKDFVYYQPTELIFGSGRIKEIGELVARYGRRCLIVTGPRNGSVKSIYPRVETALTEAGIEIAHFDGVVPNPTTDTVAAGAKVGKQHKADVVLGLGGGSSMDSAKAIAVEITHEGTCWDYFFFQETQPTEKTLPIIAVPTTAGTGSHVTQGAVITHTPTRNKSALWHRNVYCRAALIDPELTLSVPAHTTAVTGFDIFTHAFESMISSDSTILTDLMAVEAMQLIAENLLPALRDGNDIRVRTHLAWADTLAGMCITNAGVTLPHSYGMGISGMYPHIAHGEALASVYAACTRWSWNSDIKNYAAMARILDPALKNESDEKAAEKSTEVIEQFLKAIGLRIGLEGMNVQEEDLDDLARQCRVITDWEIHPRVASLEDMKELLKESYTI